MLALLPATGASLYPWRQSADCFCQLGQMQRRTRRGGGALCSLHAEQIDPKPLHCCRSYKLLQAVLTPEMPDRSPEKAVLVHVHLLHVPISIYIYICLCVLKPLLHTSVEVLFYLRRLARTGLRLDEAQRGHGVGDKSSAHRAIPPRPRRNPPLKDNASC